MILSSAKTYTHAYAHNVYMEIVPYGWIMIFLQMQRSPRHRNIWEKRDKLAFGVVVCDIILLYSTLLAFPLARFQYDYRLFQYIARRPKKKDTLYKVRMARVRSRWIEWEGGKKERRKKKRAFIHSFSARIQQQPPFESVSRYSRCETWLEK